MKKVILSGLLLVAVVAACIFFYKGSRDAISAATVFPKNEAPAPSTPVEEDVRIGLGYESLDILLEDLNNKKIGENSITNNPIIIFYEDKNEIQLCQDIEIDDTYILNEIELNLNSYTLTFTSNGFIELTNCIMHGGIINIIGQYTEEHIFNIYEECTIDNCAFVIGGEANVLYVIYTYENSYLHVINCIFEMVTKDIEVLRVIGINGHFSISSGVFWIEQGHKNWESVYIFPKSF